MTNIQLKRKNKEIDLLAVSPTTKQYFHVESRVSTTFKLKPKATYSKGRCHKEGLDYFQKEKFEHPTVKQKIHEVFGDVDYHKVLVVWDTQDNFAGIAERQYGIKIMGLRGMIHEFTHKKITSGSRDDILRVLEFVYLLQREGKVFLRRLNKSSEHKQKE